MDIKKIILEEINDFEWAEETIPIELTDPMGWIGLTIRYTDKFKEYGYDHLNNTEYRINDVTPDGKYPDGTKSFSIELEVINYETGETNFSRVNTLGIISGVNKGDWVLS